MSLQDVKVLLGTDDERVDIIYDKTEQRLLERLKRSLADVTSIPTALDYVVDEVTIARFNRIGSEGMQSESMDGHSATYAHTDLATFEHDIQAYIHSFSETKRGVVRFL